jgi:hypothetical protein
VQRHGSIELALRNESALLLLFSQARAYTCTVRLSIAVCCLAAIGTRTSRSLEQLRALEHGAMIKVIEASTPSIRWTLEDLEQYAQYLSSEISRLKRRCEISE